MGAIPRSPRCASPAGSRSPPPSSRARPPWPARRTPQRPARRRAGLPERRLRLRPVPCARDGRRERLPLAPQRGHGPRDGPRGSRRGDGRADGSRASGGAGGRGRRGGAAEGAGSGPDDHRAEGGREPRGGAVVPALHGERDLHAEGLALRRGLPQSCVDSLPGGGGEARLRYPGRRAGESINGWVARKTKDKIKDLVPEGLPRPNTRLVLANAIHFKANWQDPFYVGATVDGPFTTPGGKVVTVKRMRRGGHLRYAETAAAHVVELPYQGRDTSMVVIVPKAVDGVGAVVAGLVERDLRQGARRPRLPPGRPRAAEVLVHLDVRALRRAARPRDAAGLRCREGRLLRHHDGGADLDRRRPPQGVRRRRRGGHRGRRGHRRAHGGEVACPAPRSP